MKKHWKKILIVLIVIIIMAALAIIAKKTIDKLSNEVVSITINSQEIKLNKESKSKVINLQTFNNENDTIIRKLSGYGSIYINGQKLKNNEELNLGKIEISRDSKISIDIKYINGEEFNFIVNTLPEAFPGYEVQGESDYEGDYYTSTYSFKYDGAHYIFKLDKSGNIKYYKKTKMVSFDFRKERNSQGQVRYMYLEATKNNFEGATSLLPCDLVILDENYNEIKRINYLCQDGSTISLENHTYIYFDDDHYILTTYENRKKEINGRTMYVSDCLIEEVKDGKILWEFDSGEYPELYNYSTKENLNYLLPYQDYIHINSICIDEKDGNILCSFRNIDSVLKISREDGKLIWTLGGMADEFKLTEEQKFSKQHSIIHIGNDTILLYDNGNTNKRSRILKMKLDEENKTVTEYKEYDLDTYAPMMGSVRVLDEESQTYLICYGGGSNYYDKYSIEEINFSTGEEKFKFTFLLTRMMYNVNKIK